MNIRHPVRSGSFYESSPSSCRLHAEKLLDSVELPTTLPRRLLGGLVPHAGWMYSGAVAAKTIKALHESSPLSTVVLFGADHVGVVHRGEVFDSGVWRTPTGEVAIDEEVAQAIMNKGETLFRANPQAHSYEHSLEVQVPLLQHLSADIKIVPIAVPATALAVDIGQTVGQVLAAGFPNVRVIGSTDLTHHGGHFPAPGGRGEHGAEWSRKNDRRILDLIERLDAAAVIDEAEQHGNACGAGAIAATIAACFAMGADTGITLEYTTSYDVIHAIYPDEPDDTTVGYAAVVFA